ncbi:putative RNA-binding motif protein, X chromosome isoform X2 [Microtus ochrogaster]|uniref:Putative RNA-binding motif protein, X chromosome isoform X2 n=1 Tax=Microtus ochrogaster TaxID=79684 RepID=A0A8J6GQ39_MICOH|nr:putative RNA-binding motif protein, X chromosome isoform X2 [Microtus ochrogaster]
MPSGPVRSSSGMGGRAQYHMEEIPMEAFHKGNPCCLPEIFICPQEIMDILQKTTTQAEITQTPVTPEIMHHPQEITITVIIIIPVHVTTTHQEAMVIEMDTVRIVTIQIQVEVPTEIHVRVTVIHAVYPLYEGRHHLMEEAVAMMITAAQVMDMVEVETVTQAAEVISTQVAVIILADKKGAPPSMKRGVPSSA